MNRILSVGSLIRDGVSNHNQLQEYYCVVSVKPAQLFLH